MSELDLKEYRHTNRPGRLVDIMNTTDNIIDIFAEATQCLINTIKCDFITVLLNNGPARHFYLPPALNPTHAEPDKDSIIPYKETSLTDLLRSHRARTRDDLSGRGTLSPGDLKFLVKGAKSDLSVPIINRNKVLAIINLSSIQVHYFTKAHQLQTEEIASLLGLALERADLIEKMNQNNSRQPATPVVEKRELTYEQPQLSVFAKIIDLTNSEHDLEPIVQKTLIALKEVVYFDYAQLTLFNASGEHIQSYTIISDQCRQYSQLKNWTILEGCETYWYDFNHQPLRQQLENNRNDIEGIEQHLRSRIPTILMDQNRYLGMLVIGSLEPNFYQEFQVEFVHQTARLITLLIKYHRLAQEYEHQVIDSSVQSELSNLIDTNLDLNHILSTIVKFSAQKLQASLASIVLIENNEPLPGITVNDPNMDKTLFWNFEREYVIPKVLKSNEPFVLETICYDDLKPNKAGSNSIAYKTYLAMPLRSKGKIIGNLTIYWSKPYQINAKLLCLMNCITQQATTTIENVILYQDMLQYAEQLEKSNKELENFVHSVSHDLKTPLASIHGFTSLLLDELEDQVTDENYRYLERIRYNTIKLQRLIDNLFELYSVGQEAYHYEMMNMIDIVSQAKHELGYMIHRNKIKFIVENKMPAVYCDRKRMANVFVNLIDNAIKFMGENNKKPVIKIGYRHENGKDVYFVRDNGLGIKKDLQQNIFNLFRNFELFEGDNKGRGLGLAIAKKIIENHQGTMWLESEEGKGSTFYFSLPVRKF